MKISYEKNFIHFRIEQPEKFDSYKSRKLSNGIVYRLGFHDGNKKPTVQAILFPVKSFDLTKARTWFTNHFHKSNYFEKFKMHVQESKFVVLDIFGLVEKSLTKKEAVKLAIEMSKRNNIFEVEIVPQMNYFTKTLLTKKDTIMTFRNGKRI
jgi:hypothetical protein